MNLEASHAQSIYDQFAPYPGAEFVQSFIVEDRTMGIYLADNGTPEGEEVLVRLPNDFASRVLTELEAQFSGTQNVNIDTQSPTPYRDVMYSVLGLRQGDSAREQIKTGFWELGQSFREQIPLWRQTATNIYARIQDSVRTAYDSLDTRSRRQIAGLGMVGVLAAGGLLGGLVSENGQSPKEAHVASEYIAQPHTIDVSYVVPDSSPRVVDLAVAMDMQPQEVSAQLEKQLGKKLGSTDRLPAGQTLDLKAQGTAYEPAKDDTIASLSERFGVPPNVLFAANPELRELKGGQPVAQALNTVTIPRPVAIVQPPATMTVAEVAKLPGIAELAGDTSDLAEIDPDFDGSVMVIPIEASATAETPSTSSSSTSSEAPTTTNAPSTNIETSEQVSQEVQRVNSALDKIGLDKPNDISELVDAVIAMDAAFRPHDKDRMPDTPEGTVKMMLPNEAVGIEVPYTVAERTADVERYTSPQTYATFLATAKLYQLRAAQFPGLEGSMLRMRDGDAPAHKTHNDGTSLDISSAMGWTVQQYADGPFGDYDYSKNFNKDFNEALLKDMGHLTIGNTRVIHRVLSSGNTMVPEVNGALGFTFLKDVDDNHKDHFHLIIDPSFAQPQWRPRAANLPWSVDQDLRIGASAQSISAEQHASQHADFEDWVARLNQPPATTTSTTEAPTTTEAPKLPIDSLPASTQDFLKAQLPKVEALKGTYQEIEKQTGVPWQLMAALHYREGMNNPGQSMMAGEPIGSVNPDQGEVIGSTLLANGVQAAEHFKAMAKDVYGIDIRADMSRHEIAEAFLAYNRGHKYERVGIEAERSPYVSNGLPGHENMHFPYSGEPASTRGELDKRPGAIALLIGLNYISE